MTAAYQIFCFFSNCFHKRSRKNVNINANICTGMEHFSVVLRFEPVLFWFRHQKKKICKSQTWQTTVINFSLINLSLFGQVRRKHKACAHVGTRKGH